MNSELERIARLIDHTNLKPFATRKDIEKLCTEALQYNFWSVCVNPSWVEWAYKLLKNSDVKVCTVIGFPLGATLSTVKVHEARKVIDVGAAEVDMVLNIGALKDGDHNVVKNEIEKVVEVASEEDVLVKVILETCYLTEDEIVTACRLVKEAGAHFVKTSTGFGTAGATLEHVKLMRVSVGEMLGVKASGGIRTREQVLAMIDAGATRIGTSSGVSIMEEIIQIDSNE